ncbi:MAG: response regulator transcription factor [Sulfuricurvum sp.]|uniref:response regulator n=1 Tax=Sulfuricurvum sp. TaxID=2025608 RepID=UPI0027212123|nr:response regulator transcription factor [Sulfuricurvum sp.]MDO9057240.1 response regulator transcription factor [Sulfuricurvum sp.]
MKAQELILIIEDDQAISKMLSLSLHQHGFKTLVAADIKSAVRLIHTNSPDLIILDLGLPDGDGKGLIKKVRSELSVPIIVVSARHEEKEVIASLDAGADDYVMKPFSIDELLARVRSAQRRFLGLQPNVNVILCHEITLDIEHHLVIKKGEPLKLTPTEFNLLKYFILHRNQVLPYTRILKEIWGVGYQNEMQYLRTYINTLRKKIETDVARPTYIHTEMGIGYRFTCDSAYQE